MRPVAALAMATGLLIAAQVAAQERKDPQARFEPRSEPGAGQKLLERFVGDWDVAKAFYPRSGEPSRSVGQCRQVMIHDGRFLQSEFVFGEGTARTTGLGTIGFEPDSGRFTSIWTDSRSTRMSMRQSRQRFDGETIELDSRSLEPDGAETRRTRTVTRLEDRDRRIIHRQYALGSEGEERLMMELILTRRTGAAAPARDR